MVGGRHLEMAIMGAFQAAEKDRPGQLEGGRKLYQPHSQIAWQTPDEFARILTPRRSLALRYVKGVYGVGLRVSAVAHLEVDDVDSAHAPSRRAGKGPQGSQRDAPAATRGTAAAVLAQSQATRSDASAWLAVPPAAVAPIRSRRGHCIARSRGRRGCGHPQACQPIWSTGFLNGTQQVELTAQKLSRLTELPHSWADQRALLSI